MTRTLTAYTFRNGYPERKRITLPAEEAREELSRIIASGEWDWVRSQPLDEPATNPLRSANG